MTTHTCPSCKRVLQAPATQDRLLLALTTATMRDLTVYPCSGCGDSVVTIPEPNKLDRAVVRQIARRPGHLTGEEIRFIRKTMDHDVHTFATALGVTSAQVKLYEADRAKTGPAVERLIRVIASVFAASEEAQIREEIADLAATIGAAVDKEEQPARYYVRYRMSANDWVQASPS